MRGNIVRVLASNCQDGQSLVNRASSSMLSPTLEPICAFKEPMAETAQFSYLIHDASWPSTMRLPSTNLCADWLDFRSPLLPNESILRKRLNDDTDRFWRRFEATINEGDVTDLFLPSKILHSRLRRKVGFSVTTSSKGWIDIKIGSDTIHVPEYMSAYHPVVHMVLFAEQLSLNTFEIAKSMVPQTIIDMVEEQSNYTSPKKFEAGWSPAKSSSAGTPEDTEVASNYGSSEASLQVLELYYDGILSDHPTILFCVDKGSMISEVGCDLTVLAPEEPVNERNIMDNTGGSNGNASIHCSADKDVQPQIRETELENLWDSDSSVADHHDIEEERKIMDTWMVASAAPQHATGNRGLLSDFKPEHGLFVEAGDGEPMQVCGRGSVINDAVVLSNVLFVPGLTNNLVSASQLTELEYCLGFAHGSCFIRRMTDNMLVGKASLGEDGLFQLDYLKLPVVI